MMKALFLAPVLMLIGAAPAAQDVPEATPAGEAVDCISAHRINHTRVESDRVIDFHMMGGKVYRNELRMRCPGLNANRTIMYELHTTQLCSLDTITVIHQPGLMRGATCGLGKFQPVTLAGN
ncbi:hypothetical protein [Stakelama tenebrarum]|uniref:Uncharacterized protein n=1 Tax=Stakelama tenebrarum TaxID=2711215 RepID=A0A6G6Y9A7_9SPHN|nr:hypothetical protein [Sphingosinithalassobacter tenebrarum]QIG81515.1 hypothetical protein G5C33_18135 [Sphingosinithalassobacter tenebrarum]